MLTHEILTQFIKETVLFRFKVLECCVEFFFFSSRNTCFAGAANWVGGDPLFFQVLCDRPLWYHPQKNMLNIMRRSTTKNIQGTASTEESCHYNKYTSHTNLKANILNDSLKYEIIC